MKTARKAAVRIVSILSVLSMLTVPVLAATPSDSLTSTVLDLSAIRSTDSNDINSALKNSSNQSILNSKTNIDGSASTVDDYKLYLQKKYLTQDKLTAWQWSFIISQFAVPYYSNLLTTLQTQQVFADMASKNTTVSANPSFTGGTVDSNFSNKSVVSATNFATVKNTILSNMTYMPVYNSNNKQISVKDFLHFDASAASSVKSFGYKLYIHDKYIYRTDGTNKDIYNANSGMFDADLLSNYETDMFDLNSLNTLKDSSKIKTQEVSIPIYMESDITDFYNQLFLSSYVQYRSIGTDVESKSFQSVFSDAKSGTMVNQFVASISGDTVVADSYGDLLYQDGTTYRMLYPNYANPIYFATYEKTFGAGIVSSSGGDGAASYTGISGGPGGTDATTPNPNYSDLLKSAGIEPVTGFTNAYDYISAKINPGTAKSSSNGSLFLDNEVLALYNKAIATAYTTDVLPETYKGTQNPSEIPDSNRDALSSTTGNNYVDKFLSSGVNSQSYKNMLLLIKSPGIIRLPTFSGGVNYDSAITTSGAWQAWAKATSLGLPFVSGSRQFSYYVGKISTQGAVDISSWVNGEINPITSFILDSPAGTDANAVNASVFKAIKGSDATTYDPYWNIAYRVNAIANPGGTITLNSRTLNAESENMAQRGMEAAAIGTQQFFSSFVLKTLNQNTLYQDIKNSQNTDSKTTYLVYIPVPSNSVDTASSWNIFTDSNGMFMTWLRPFKLNGQHYTEMFQNSALGQSYDFDTIFYKLRDNRVSDSWMNCSEDDVFITAYVWLNYYINQLSLSQVLNSQYKTLNGWNLQTVNWNYGKDLNNSIVGQTNGGASVQGLAYEPSSASNLSATLVATERGTTYSADADRVMFNPYSLMMGLQANTEATVDIKASASSTAVVQVDFMNILQAFWEFIQNPLTSLGNIISGILQLLHNAVAVGNMSSIFDMSWITSNSMYKIACSIFMILMTIVVCLVTVIQGVKYTFLQSTKLSKSITRVVSVILISLLPQIMILETIKLNNVITDTSMGTIQSYVAASESEMNTRNEVNADAGFDTGYALFKQQFSNISDVYKNVTIQQLKNYDTGTTPEYTTVKLSDLSDASSFKYLSSVAAGVYANRTVPAAKIWYDKDNFVPVHYSLYSDNIYYYFYDYIKWQYLHYFSDPSEAEKASGLSSAQLLGFSNYADSFSNFGNSDTNAANSNFLQTIYSLEKGSVVNLKGGMNLMYNDLNYAYGKSLYNQQLYGGTQLQDLFGLTYLFQIPDDINTQYQGVTDTYAGSWDSSLSSKLRAELRPLGQIMSGPYWQAYKNSDILGLQVVPGSDGSEYSYPFMSKYIKADSSAVNNGLSLYSHTGALGSTESLYEAFEKSLQYRKPTGTALEQSLSSLNSKMYSDIVSVLSYRPTEISDASEMQIAALICTFDFNSAFGKKTLLSTAVSPTGYSMGSMDMDKVMRTIYADKISDMTDNLAVMYMLWGENMGLIYCILVLATEIYAFLIGISRVALMLEIFALSGVSAIVTGIRPGNTHAKDKLGAAAFYSLFELFTQFVMIMSLNTAGLILGGKNGFLKFVVCLALVFIFRTLFIGQKAMLRAIRTDYRSLGSNAMHATLDNFKSKFNRGDQQIDNATESVTAGEVAVDAANMDTPAIPPTTTPTLDAPLNLNAQQLSGADTSKAETAKKEAEAQNLSAKTGYTQAQAMESITKSQPVPESVVDDMTHPISTTAIPLRASSTTAIPLSASKLAGTASYYNATAAAPTVKSETDTTTKPDAASQKATSKVSEDTAKL